MLSAAALLWALGREAAPSPAPAAPPGMAGSPLGVAGSPYGELVARLLRPGLDDFWHLGRAAHDVTTMPPQETLPAEPPAGPAARLQALKKAGKAPNTPVPPTGGLRRFAAAAAERRLDRALRLAPADWVLLEVALLAQIERLDREPHRRARIEALVAAAVARGSRADATLSEALAGAGAAATVLLEMEKPGPTGTGPAGSAAALAALDTCLQRYRERHHEFVERGWWSGIPELRRAEFSRQADLLETVHQSLRQGRAAGQTAPPTPAAH